MKVFVNLVLFIVIIYNLVQRKNNIYKSEVPKSVLFMSLILIIIGLFLRNRYDKSLLGLILAFNFAIFFISFFLSNGINEKCFNVYSPNAIVIQNTPYEKVDRVRLKEKDNKLFLEIDAYGNKFFQSYKLDINDEIILFLKDKPIELLLNC